jgi:hypothetical protein
VRISPSHKFLFTIMKSCGASSAVIGTLEEVPFN